MIRPLIRDYSATAHVHAAYAMRRPFQLMSPLTSRTWDAAVQSTMTMQGRRYGTLAHAWLIGFGDVA